MGTVTAHRRGASTSPIKPRISQSTHKSASISPLQAVHINNSSLRAQLDAIRRSKDHQSHHSRPRRSVSSTDSMPFIINGAHPKRSQHQGRTASVSISATSSPGPSLSAAEADKLIATSSDVQRFIKTSPRKRTPTTCTPPKRTSSKLRLRKSTPAVGVAQSPTKTPTGGRARNIRAGTEPL